MSIAQAHDQIAMQSIGLNCISRSLCHGQQDLWPVSLFLSRTRYWLHDFAGFESYFAGKSVIFYISKLEPNYTNFLIVKFRFLPLFSIPAFIFNSCLFQFLPIFEQELSRKAGIGPIPAQFLPNSCFPAQFLLSRNSSADAIAVRDCR